MTSFWLVNLLISLLFPLSLGYITLTILSRGKTINLALSLALSYGLGVGLLSQWMLILGIFDIPWDLSTIVIPLAIILSLFGFIYKKPKYPVDSDSNPLFPLKTSNASPTNATAYKIIYVLLITYICFSLAFIFYRCLTMPIQSWDALTTSAFKAKIFFYDRSLHHLNLPHASYPLLVPLTESWIALNLNAWDDLLVKIIFPLAMTSYVTIHYFFLRTLTGRNWALGGVCLLLSAPLVFHHSTIAYREIFQMYFNITAILLILWWNRNKNDSLLLLAACFAGLTTSVKLEGIGYLLIHTLLLSYILIRENTLIRRVKMAKLFKFIVPICLFFLPFYFYKTSLNISGLENRTNLALTSEHFARIPGILQDFRWNLFFSGNWNFLWFLLLVSFLGNGWKFQKRSEIKLLTFTIAAFFAVYLTVLTLTSATIDAPTTLSRVIIHFFPLATLLIILLNCPGPSSDSKTQAP